MEERVARSVALENAYVYDVYEQFNDNPQSKPWPKVKLFLDSLEPGSVICDVGCGNGKYLNVNNTIFNIGGDKSTRLTTVAHEKNNEVIILDNLALPFRDNSLDAVVSIAVVHHLATTDRRISAIRELARVLRIGGRIIISVWAMEQTHRKFESQDVLVPWKRPRNLLETPSLELTTSATSTSEDDGLLIPYSAYSQTSDTESGKSIKSKLSLKSRRNRKTRNLSHHRHSSPSSSSLSSPNETCYSFVRKAIQRLAGSRRVSVNKPWFLESWSVANRETSKRHYDGMLCACSDCAENTRDIPIELRSIDNDETLAVLNTGQRRKTFPTSQLDLPVSEAGCGTKSQSLTNMKTNDDSIEEKDTECDDRKNKLAKPKLVKQKKSICEEDAEEALDQATDMADKTHSSFFFKTLHVNTRRRNGGGVMKQRSLNEELMSDRLEEKERVRQNIQKQVSLNEDLIYERRSFESFRDSTSKKLQLIKTGFTKKIRNSNIEKVTGQSLKNGFARMFQNWKSTKEYQAVQASVVVKEVIERKSSKEDGSDSSKDSSLQSDTSVDSEDSFASVIFVPKSNPMSPTRAPMSSDPTSPKIISSPKIRQSSCPTSPRVKQTPLPIYPLIKQLSSPKPNSKDPETPTKLTENDTKLAQKYAVVRIPEFKKTDVEENCNESIRNEKLKKIREILTENPGFGMKNSKFPLIRHSSVANGKVSAEPLPKLVSLELFNPETDDKDSDSSTVSSPDSVDSIVSVKSDHRNRGVPEESHFKFPTYKNTKQSKLLEAAVGVASSLDEAVTKVIKASPELSKRHIESKDDVDRSHGASSSFVNTETANFSYSKSNDGINLRDLTNELSVQLLKEISDYQEKTKHNTWYDNLNDTYISRLNSELDDLTKISVEIRRQNEYLTKMGKMSSCLECEKIRTEIPKFDEQTSNTSSDSEVYRLVHRLGNSTDSCEDSDKGSSTTSMISMSVSSDRTNDMEKNNESSSTNSLGGSTASLVSAAETKLENGNQDENRNKRLEESQESLVSDNTSGGEITYHRYYHVFREGELDQLIEKYVENLHIISSYYDHASWCIVAEKVQVWTI